MGFSPNGGGRGGRGTAVAGGGMDMPPATAVQAYQDGYRTATASAGGGVGGAVAGGRSGGVGRSGTMTPAVKPLEEDLGTQNQNGVPAQGTRNTITIPAGQIGNNRDIHVVNERWYSSDLQMLVKSVNSDPRFGTTTYQLTNIIRSMPDAGLFQIPGSYTVDPENGQRRFAPAVGKIDQPYRIKPNLAKPVEFLYIGFTQLGGPKATLSAISTPFILDSIPFATGAGRACRYRMQLTRAADYAVRVMIHLAKLEPGARASRGELAVAAECPEQFLAKVLQSLTHAGLVVSHRGNTGGFEIPASRRATLRCWK